MIKVPPHFVNGVRSLPSRGSLTPPQRQAALEYATRRQQSNPNAFQELQDILTFCTWKPFDEAFAIWLSQDLDPAEVTKAKAKHAEAAAMRQTKLMLTEQLKSGKVSKAANLAEETTARDYNRTVEAMRRFITRHFKPKKI